MYDSKSSYICMTLSKSMLFNVCLHYIGFITLLYSLYANVQINACRLLLNAMNFIIACHDNMNNIILFIVKVCF